MESNITYHMNAFVSCDRPGVNFRRGMLKTMWEGGAKCIDVKIYGQI